MGKKLHFMLSGPELHDEKPHAASHALGGDDELSISGTQIIGGLIATARMGSGTADSTSFYRGNSTWVTRNMRKGVWPVMQSGRWYDMGTTFNVGYPGGVGLAGSNIGFNPILIPTETTFNQIGVTVTSAVAGSTLRLGIYAPRYDGRPGKLVLSTSALSSATTGDITAAINVTLRGLFWLAYFASTTLSVQAFSAVDHRYLGDTTIITTTKKVLCGYALTYGALPATAGTVSTGLLGAKVGLRVA